MAGSIIMMGSGVWPTMITPFDDNNKVDFRGLESIVKWYMEKEVDGIFTVCQSSEMFFLKLEERVEIAWEVALSFPIIYYIRVVFLLI